MFNVARGYNYYYEIIITRKTPSRLVHLAVSMILFQQSVTSRDFNSKHFFKFKMMKLSRSHFHFYCTFHINIFHKYFSLSETHLTTNCYCLEFLKALSKITTLEKHFETARLKIDNFL